MRFAVERWYAAWLIEPVRSASVTSRWSRLLQPHIVITNALWLLWGAVFLWVYLSRRSWGEPGTIALVPLAAGLLAWVALRLVVECLPAVSVLRYRLTTGAPAGEVPEQVSIRVAGVQEEWTSRAGADVAASAAQLARCARIYNATSLVSMAVYVVVITAVVVVAGAASPGLLLVMVVILIAPTQWARTRLNTACKGFLSDLAVVFGEPLPPGPPADPERFRAWVGETVVGRPSTV